MSLFSDRLTLARKKIGLTQQDMANQFDITRSAYSAWEIGRNEPPFSFIHDFCTTYKISADYLIGLSDSMVPPVPVSVQPVSISRNPYADLSPEHQAALDSLAETFRQQEAWNSFPDANHDCKKG